MNRPDITNADVIDAVLDHGDRRMSAIARSLGMSREAVRGRLRQIANLPPRGRIQDHQLIRFALSAWERSQPTETEVIQTPEPPPAREWRSQAACLDADPELFFPVGETGPAIAQTQEAKAYCRRCPVMRTCRTWAMETRQDHGVWGGLDERERDAHRRRIQRAKNTEAVAS